MGQQNRWGSLRQPTAQSAPGKRRSAGHAWLALAAQEPELVITGHGRPMRGDKMRTALHLLARDFDRIAVPEHGHYVRAAA